MKLFTRFVALVVLSVVGFRQYRNYCEDNSAAFCQYTSPSNYDWYQQRVVPWWDERIEPYRVQYVTPYLSKAHVYHERAAQWVVPKAKVAYYSCKDVFDTKVYPTLYQWYKTGSFKFQLYYNIYAVPSFKHVQNTCAKWINGRPNFQKFMHTLHSLKESTTYYATLSRDYTVHKFLEARTAFQNFRVPSKTVEESEDEQPSEEVKNESSLEPEVEEDDEYVEEETIFLTSTIYATVTLSDDQFQMTPAASLTPDTSDDAPLDIPIKDLVQDEFQAWSSTVERKAANTLDQFDHEIESLVSEKLEKIRPEIMANLQNISNSTQEYYQRINLAILDVDCTVEIDPSTGEHIYFNNAGTQLREYITRPLMREYFAMTREHIEQHLDLIKKQLEEFVGTVNASVEDIRQEHLEVYEEWGDVMVSEWSKRMAYVDVVAAMDADDMDEQQHENWKNFLKLKKQVIRTRDLLMEHPAKLQALEKFIRDIQFTLKALQRESGEYLYILRSKANLAFQSREKLEHEREERERYERERLQREKEESERISVEMLINSMDSTIPHPEESADEEIPVVTQSEEEDLA